MLVIIPVPKGYDLSAKMVYRHSSTGSLGIDFDLYFQLYWFSLRWLLD